MKGPDECSSPIRGNQKFSSPAEDFSEYLWMADELEDFDKKCEQEFWEECFIELCFEQMLEEEEERETEVYVKDDMQEDMEAFLKYTQEVLKNSINLAMESKLNPLAQEFVPIDQEAQDATER